MTHPLARSTRVMASALMSALVMIALALYFVLPDPWAAPPWWVPAAQVAAGVAVHLFNDSVGYRTPALGPGTPEDDATTRSVQAYSQTMLLRFVPSEGIAIVSVALAFVLGEGGFLTYLGGAAVSLALLAVHVWPWARPVGRTTASLERDGGRSHLHRAFGLADPGPGGAVRRL